MPSLVNELLHAELERAFEGAGSCLVLSFDKLTVEDDSELRGKLRDEGLSYKVVKNRLAARVAKKVNDVDIGEALVGKCGVVFAPEERAITAAKIVRELMKPKKKDVPIHVTGGIIEGSAITGDSAARIADMPDRDTVRGMIATAAIAPARGLATVVNGVAGGLARCLQAKIDKED